MLFRSYTVNGFNINWLGRIWLYRLPQQADRVRDTLIIAALHSPGVFAYLFRGQNDVGVPHEIQQQGKFAGPQIDQPPAYFHDSARRVYEKIPPPGKEPLLHWLDQHNDYTLYIAAVVRRRD